MPHDIIDKCNEKLPDHIERILPGSERGCFAAGYLFLSDLKPIHRHLEQLREIRLFIGNTTDKSLRLYMRP